AGSAAEVKRESAFRGIELARSNLPRFRLILVVLVALFVVLVVLVIFVAVEIVVVFAFFVELAVELVVGLAGSHKTHEAGASPAVFAFSRGGGYVDQK